MAVTSTELKIEIGATAYDELDSDEIGYICGNSASIAFAGLKAFEILMKKYKPSYKMGKLFCNDGDKYKAYRDMFVMYSRQFSAGTLKSKSDSDVISWI